MLYWCQVWGYRVLVPAGIFSEVLVSQGVCLSSSNAVLVPGLGIQSLGPSWYILWGIGISGCLFVFIKCCIGARSGDTESWVLWSQLVYSLRYWYLRVFVCLYQMLYWCQVWGYRVLVPAGIFSEVLVSQGVCLSLSNAVLVPGLGIQSLGYSGPSWFILRGIGISGCLFVFIKCCIGARSGDTKSWSQLVYSLRYWYMYLRVFVCLYQMLYWCKVWVYRVLVPAGLFSEVLVYQGVCLSLSNAVLVPGLGILYIVLGTLVPAGIFSEVLVSQGVCLSLSNAVLVPGLGIQSLGPSWYILWGIGISGCLFVFIKCCIGARSGDTESWSQLVYSLRYWYLRVFVCLHQMLYWCQVWGYRVLGTLVPAGLFSEVLVSQGVCLSLSNAVLVPGLGDTESWSQLVYSLRYWYLRVFVCLYQMLYWCQVWGYRVLVPAGLFSEVLGISGCLFVCLFLSNDVWWQIRFDHSLVFQWLVVSTFWIKKLKAVTKWHSNKFVVGAIYCEFEYNFWLSQTINFPRPCVGDFGSFLQHWLCFFIVFQSHSADTVYCHYLSHVFLSLSSCSLIQDGRTGQGQQCPTRS